MYSGPGSPRLERNVAAKVQRAGSFVTPQEVQRFLRA
jgi:hypothetical protein